MTNLTHTTDPAQIVTEFLDSMTAADFKTTAAALSHDAWWLNVGLPIVRGRQRITANLKSMNRYCSFAVQTHHLAVEQPSSPQEPTIVLTERTDVLSRGRFRCEFWVCGRFEVRDGLITGWKDYYSLGNMAAGMVRGAIGALRS